jgi:hypothetical protein
MHPFGAAIKALIRTPAHRRLIFALTVEARDDHIRNLLDEVFNVAVVCVWHERKLS